MRILAREHLHSPATKRTCTYCLIPRCYEIPCSLGVHFNDPHGSIHAELRQSPVDNIDRTRFACLRHLNRIQLDLVKPEILFEVFSSGFREGEDAWLQRGQYLFLYGGWKR